MTTHLSLPRHSTNKRRLSNFVKSKRADKSTGGHRDDKSSSNGCVSNAIQSHFQVVSNVHADARVVLDDMRMQGGVSFLFDYTMGAMQDDILADYVGYFPGNMDIDRLAGQSEDDSIGSLSDIGGPLENEISSEFVGRLPEMGFEEMVGQSEDGTLDYLLNNNDFDGIMGQSAFEISSDHVT